MDFHLKSHKNQITVNKCIQRVRKIIKLPITEGYLDKDPFNNYKPKSYKKEVLFLTTAELEFLKMYSFSQQRL
ncbi:MAG: hypothetical protein JKY48_10715 [Flavobacteriales bacterium]|nr:hypothetical protein [Flavobacteriales bacterium]